MGACPDCTDCGEPCSISNLVSCFRVYSGWGRGEGGRAGGCVYVWKTGCPVSCCTYSLEQGLEPCRWLVVSPSNPPASVLTVLGSQLCTGTAAYAAAGDSTQV